VNGRHTLRASDTDRDQIAERLRVAATEGRLSTEEFDARLGAALKARTYHELDRLVADLPGKKLAPRRSTARSLASSHPVAATAIAVATITVAIAALAIVAMIGAAWIGWMVFAWIFFGAKRGRYTRMPPDKGRPNHHLHQGLHPHPRSSPPSRSSYWA
jgi:Domain of unknown function (DUF1707)